MARFLKNITAAFIIKLGKFSLGTVGSLRHGGSYVAVTLKGDRVGWVSFTTRILYAYKPKHQDFDDAKRIIEVWFRDDMNFNQAAKAWNDMNLGIYVPMIGEKK